VRDLIRNLKKTINALVIDSFHTGAIVRNLSAYYARKHPETQFVCFGSECPEGVRADIFVLSALHVLEKRDYVKRLKNSKGKPNTKVLVVSALDDFLERVNTHPELGADFTLPKPHLSPAIGESRFPESEVTLTLDFLLIAALNAQKEEVPQPR